MPEVDRATVARAEEGEVEPEVVQVAAKEEVVNARTFFLHLADAPGLESKVELSPPMPGSEPGGPCLHSLAAPLRALSARMAVASAGSGLPEASPISC